MYVFSLHIVYHPIQQVMCIIYIYIYKIKDLFTQYEIYTVFEYDV